MTTPSNTVAHSPEYIHNRASAAAANAAAAYLAEGHHWFPCGFAWVNISPARGPFVTYLRKNDIGGKAYGGGWQIWNPSGNHTQSMEALKEGAKAYAQEVKRLGGPDVFYDCRMD